MGRRQLVVVGDTVLDRDVDGWVERVCPDAPVPVVDVARETSGPGGAGLTALLCAQGDVEVTLVTPLADDEAAAQLAGHLTASSVRILPLAQHGPTRQKTRIRAAGQSLVRVDRGGPGHPVGDPPATAVEAVRDADVVLVSCYGAGTSTSASIREILRERAHTRPVVWDPHPRGGAPVPGCALVTPNLAEARAETRMPGAPGDEVAVALLTSWRALSVAVTAGALGAWFAGTGGRPILIPASPRAGDTCGAGDSFAAAAAVALATGRSASHIVIEAVAAASEFVRLGGAAAFRAGVGEHAQDPQPDAPGPGQAGDPSESALGLVRRTQSRGGVVWRPAAASTFCTQAT